MVALLIAMRVNGAIVLYSPQQRECRENRFSKPKKSISFDVAVVFTVVVSYFCRNLGLHALVVEMLADRVYHQLAAAHHQTFACS